MKRFLLGILLCLCTATFAHAQTTDFDRFVDMDGVTSVYVSKAMFDMMTDMQPGGLDLKGIINKLESMQVLSSEKSSVIEKMKNTARHALTRSNGYETLVRIHDNGEDTDIYQKKHSDKLNEFIVVTQEKKEFTVILITGRLDRDDLKGMIHQ